MSENTSEAESKRTVYFIVVSYERNQSVPVTSVQINVPDPSKHHSPLCATPSARM